MTQLKSPCRKGAIGLFRHRAEAAAPTIERAPQARWSRKTKIATGAILTVSLALAVWLWSRAHAPVPLPSIAVIPLENLSADASRSIFRMVLPTRYLPIWPKFMASR